MLYFLLYEQLYRWGVGPFRVFRYVTFRTAFASLTALFLCIALGPWLISKLRQFQIGQYIREEGPAELMRGLGPNTNRAILMTISQLSSYDMFKQTLLHYTPLHESSSSLHFSASLLAVRPKTFI